MCASQDSARHESEQRFQELLATVTRQQRDLELRDHVRTMLAQVNNLPQIGHCVVTAVQAAFPATTARLYLCAGTDLILQQPVGVDHRPASPGANPGICDQVVASGMPILRVEQPTDPSLSEHGEERTSELCVPLVEDVAVVGVLHVIRSRGMPLTASDVQLMLAVSAHMVMALRRLRLTHELRHERDLSAAIVDTADSLILVLDRAGRIVRFNHACERTSGYQFDEVQGQSCEILLPPEDIAAVRSRVALVLSGAPARHGEQVWLTREGQRRVIAWLNTTLLDVNGHLDYIVSTGIDITIQRQAEQKLRESESVLSGFYDSTPFLMGVLELQNDDLRFVAVNKAVAQRFGRSQAEMAGLSLQHVMTRTDFDQWIANCRDSLRSTTTVSFEYQRQFNQQTHWRMASIGPIQGRMGHLPRFAYIVEDISERKQAEAILARARDTALESSRLKSEFLATVSHEIRTPMNGVIGMTELLLDTVLDADQHEFAQTISDSAQALLTIIDDILDYSKIEAGKLLLTPADVSLSELIGSISSILSARVRAKGLALVIEIGAGVPPDIRADAGRLRQILLNIVGNAIKFTAQGQITVRIDHEPAADRGLMLRFTITDTGVGIPAAALQRLFQPFMQADGSVTRKYGGTGLGLAISRSLAELMGGAIGCESREGIGSVFWFTIRCDEATVSSRDLPARSHQPRPIRTQTTTRRILLAEDHRVNQELAVRQLAKLGYAVEVVVNGQDAVTMIQRGTPVCDLILMDCHMPLMDGYTATRAIRAFEQLHGGHIPIIAMTASALQSDRDVCLAAGMDDFLSKPVRQEELRSMLERWLGDAPSVMPQPPPMTAGLIDAHVLDEVRSFEDETPGLFMELVHTYLEDADAQMNALAAALTDADTSALTQAAHRLRGSSLVLGAIGMARICEQLESAGRAGAVDCAADLLAQLTTTLIKTRLVLESAY